jgi:iron complex outermembrane receptor protein
MQGLWKGSALTLASVVAVSGLTLTPGAADAQEAVEQADGGGDQQQVAGDPEAEGEPKDAARGAIEEIVVTAQKREQSVQDVPIAITALSAESLSQRGLTNISQINDSTPNVEIDYTSPFSGSSSVLSPFIRGIGQNDFAFNLEPGVGVYVDGVYYARTFGAVVDLLELDRVEVLKGPQGTLFGRNSIGGALNIITREPDSEFRYNGEVVTGRFNRVDVRGAVDIPLSERVLTQLSFSSKRRDGYQRRIRFPAPGPFATDVGQFITASDRIGGDESGNENQQSVRGKISWRASDTFDLTLAADYMHVDEQASPSTLLDVDDSLESGSLANLYNTCISLPVAVLEQIGLGAACGPRGTIGTSLAGVNADGDPNNDRLLWNDQFITDDIDETYAQGSNFSLLTGWGAAATANWAMTPSTTLKSITAYREVSSIFGVDIGGAPINGGDTSFDTSQEQLTQELQLSANSFEGALNWLVGAFYFQEEGDLTDFVPFVEGIVQVFGENLFDNKAWALFAHLDYAVTDRFSLTGGIRYTKEDKEFEGRQRDLNAFPSKVGFPAFLHPDPNDLTRIYPLGVNTKEFTDWSPKLSASFHVSDEVMTYVSFSQGFKSGGWTTRLLVPEVTEDGRPGPAPDFDPETATAFEVGLKSRALDSRVQLNLAAFTTDYEQIQIVVQRGVSPTFENAGDGRIRGFEVELQGLVSDSFNVDASLGYLDAEYTSLEPGAIITLDHKFVNTPEYSFHLGAEVGAGPVWLRGDYTHKSTIYNDAENTPLLIQEPVNLLNFALTYSEPGGRWEIVFGGRNVTDERFLYSGFRNPGAGLTVGNYSRPAEWYLGVRIIG